MKKKDLLPEKPKVFICYRRRTSLDFVDHLADRLDDMFEVYYDKKHIKPEDVKKIIRPEIDECTHFILVFDEKTLEFTNENEGEKDNRLDEDEGVINDHVLAELRYVFKINSENKEKKKIITICVGGEDVINKYKQKHKKGEDENSKLIRTLLGINSHPYKKEDKFDDFFKSFLEEKMGYNFCVEKWKKVLKYALLGTLAAALLVLGGTLLQKWDSSRTPKLVFAGGGSVANMIKEITGDNDFFSKYKNSLYLDLPSENAWALLAEEVMINHTSDTVHNKFYPVCLSALEAPDSVFYKMVSKDEFMKNGTIISYRLKKDDTLKVYTNQNIGHDGIISIDDLSQKVKQWCKDKTVNIYLTQEKSGTYHIYQKLFKDSVDINSYKLEWYDGKLLKKNLENKYIVLTSEYYTPNDIKGLKPIMVVNETEDNIAKPMYLYFAGYTNSEEKDITIPKEMVNFMKHFGVTLKSQMHQDSLKVITPINSLINWETEFQKQGNKKNVRKKK